MLSAADLANTVTAYALVFSGITALAFTLLMQRQPLRWIAVYVGVIVTGAATIWYHGTAESAPAAVADISSNLLVVWLLQVAILGDYYSKSAQRWIGGVSGLLNLSFAIWRSTVDLERYRTYGFFWSETDGFYLGESLLIAGSLLVTVLFYLSRKKIPAQARPLLYLVTATFIVGVLLSPASNQQVDWQIVAYHATWHLVGSFGFLMLWAFNHVRFTLRALEQDAIT